MNAVWQQPRNAVKLCLPILSCVCSRVLSHSASMFWRLAASLSLSFTVHHLSLLCVCVSVCVCACMCVKPVTFCALTCVRLSPWQIPASRSCLCVQYLSAYTVRVACFSLCVRQMFPGCCHWSAFTHTALRKINQHFIYPFDSWICPHPSFNPP